MGQTTVRQATLLGEGDQLLDIGTQFLRLGRGRQDLLMLDERSREVAEQRVAMPGAALQLAMTNLVTHDVLRPEEHTSELQSLMRISYAVFCLKKKPHKLKI